MFGKTTFICREVKNKKQKDSGKCTRKERGIITFNVNEVNIFLKWKMHYGKPLLPNIVLFNFLGTEDIELQVDEITYGVNVLKNQRQGIKVQLPPRAKYVTFDLSNL